MKLNLILLTCILLMASCVPDNCKDVICEHEGVCVNGKCSCLYGYEGDSCEDIWYQKFTGEWTATDDSIPPSSISQYPVVVSNKRTLDTLYIYDLAEIFDTVFATRESYLSFVMKERKLNDDTVLVSGTGIVDEQTGIVTGKYSLKLVDKTVNVNYSWVR